MGNDRKTVLMTHRAKFSFDQYGLSVKFSCDATVGAQCRLSCPEGCDFFTFEGHEHELVDQGECEVLPWLDSASPEELFMNDEVIQLANLEITTEFDGDCLQWKVQT